MLQPAPRTGRENELVAVLTSAARTSTGQSAAQNAGRQPDTIQLFTNVTAASGTSPTLAISLECSTDGGTTWFTVVTGANLTAVSKQVLVGSLYQGHGVTPVYRVNYAIGGTTPSFTFTVTANVTAS